MPESYPKRICRPALLGGLLREARDDAVTIALFGARPSLVGYLASPHAPPAPDLVASVRQLRGRG